MGHVHVFRFRKHVPTTCPLFRVFCTRSGQTKNVTYIDLISPGTVDEKIVKALRDKIDIATQVLGEDLKQWLI